MLKIKPNCECCGQLLPTNSTEAMICSFECTYCATCVETVLHHVCPNCGGGFEKRPIRPKAMLSKYPASTVGIPPPIHTDRHQTYLKQYQFILPENR